MVKGQVDRPGRELRSSCTQSEALNRSCGILPERHDAAYCRQVAAKRGDILRRMREVIRKLDYIEECPQWDTWQTTNSTPGPHRFGLYQPRSKPWSLEREKSRELIGSRLYSSCECIKKNGLQDDCRRSLCRGREWCLEEPFPLCPPFTSRPSRPCPADIDTNPKYEREVALHQVPCSPLHSGQERYVIQNDTCGTVDCTRRG